MRDSDAFSWYMEEDPILRSTVVAVAWLENSPEWDVLSAKLEQATRLVPLFRKKVLEPPGRISTPRWTVDDEFDLSWHLRRFDAPPPRTAQVVVDLARREAMGAFDRSRPLWQFTLIEHLDCDRAALVMKVHHSLTDGLGGMELALLLFDTEASPARPTVLAEIPHERPVDTAELIRESVDRDIGRLARFAGGRARSVLPLLRRVTRDPVGSMSTALETAISVGRTVAPIRRPLSPIMRGRGLARSLDLVEVELADLKRAAAAAGGTVNDGFLAAVSGGLRRYHERHAASVGELRMTLPVSIRTPDDPIGGNRITLMRFALPVSDPNPASRVREIHMRCAAARRERSVPFTNVIAGVLNLLPAGVVGAMLKNVDFLASDVPGFAFPVYLGGALLERYVAFGPTIGASVNLTLLSYRGTCSVGVTTDRAAIPDHDLLVTCLREGFDELLELGGDHQPARLPLHETGHEPRRSGLPGAPHARRGQLGGVRP